MAPDRREFLRMAGLSALAMLLPASLPVSNIWAKAPSGRGRSGLSLPGAKALKAKRWAMVVDPEKCPAGCRDCIAACHLEHNVPDFGNPKDEIKWIWQERFEHVFPEESHAHIPEAVTRQSLPVLCNHCDNPPCVRVCPTRATFKRPDGIVMMDYHRCIGCRFCVAACPYGARSMNYRDPRPFIRRINGDYPTRTRGVVEKCNFCEERLARGLMPACVAACQEKALIFGDLEGAGGEIRRILRDCFTIRRRAGLGTQPQVYYLL